jgi:flagellar hook-length control protein FliK
MPTMISPPVVANSNSQPATQAASRSRGADDAQGQGFGAALERSRANGNPQRTKAADEAGTAGTASAERKPARKPGADDDGKDALPADPNLAFLPQPDSPLHALTLAGRAAAKDAAVADGAAGVGDIPVAASASDPLAQAQAQATLPGATALATDAKAVPDTDAAAADAAKPGATAAAAAAATDSQADAAPTAALQDVVRAAVAAQAMNVGTAKPGAAPASPAGATAAGRAGPRAAVSATTAEQLAGAAQPKAGEDAPGAAAAVAAVSAPVNASGAEADASSSGTPTTPATPTTPFALQHASATAASAARAEEAAAARPSVHTVEPEVGSDKWGPALGQQLARMSISGHHTAELNLNPAGLGPLKVTLSLGDSQAQAMFVSAHESVRKAVEAALPQLRTSLSEQGITLGQASVGADTRQASGQDAAFAQQQQQQQNTARQQAASYPGAGRAAASAPVTPVAAARAAPATHASAGVDTFA